MAAAADGFAPGDAPYIDDAMRTGAFQAWDGADGQHRFLTASPARAAGGKVCRDLALLVRFADGGSRVHSAERCTTEAVKEAEPSTADEEGEQ